MFVDARAEERLNVKCPNVSAGAPDGILAHSALVAVDWPPPENSW
ncbi:MAG TPA: hypothetical protein VK657_02035 [Terriglobales bacterium]|nr:hypothetical protein [Terriglobales bacterium]